MISLLRGMADVGNNDTAFLSLGIFVIFDRFCPPLSSCSIRYPKSTAVLLNLRCTEHHRLKTSTPSHSPPWSCPSSRSQILLPCAATVSLKEFVTDKPNDWNCARVDVDLRNEDCFLCLQASDRCTLIISRLWKSKGSHSCMCLKRCCPQWCLNII